LHELLHHPALPFWPSYSSPLLLQSGPFDDSSAMARSAWFASTLWLIRARYPIMLTLSTAPVLCRRYYIVLRCTTRRRNIYLSRHRFSLFYNCRGCDALRLHRQLYYPASLYLLATVHLRRFGPPKMPRRQFYKKKPLAFNCLDHTKILRPRDLASTTTSETQSIQTRTV
jgi:hypothetical protein